MVHRTTATAGPSVEHPRVSTHSGGRPDRGFGNNEPTVSFTPHLGTGMVSLIHNCSVKVPGEVEVKGSNHAWPAHSLKGLPLNEHQNPKDLAKSAVSI